jgi:hypothetical protein
MEFKSDASPLIRPGHTADGMKNRNYGKRKKSKEEVSQKPEPAKKN